MLDLRTMYFRDYSAGSANGIPTIVDAPFAGHSAVIADYHTGLCGRPLACKVFLGVTGSGSLAVMCPAC